MKKRKQHIIILVLIIGVVFLFVGHRVTWKMWDYLKALDEEVQEQQALAAQAQKEIEKNLPYVGKWDAIRNFQEVPVEEIKRTFSAYLQSLVEFANIGAADSQPIEGHEEFQILRYKLTFSVNLDELVDLLDELDRSDRLLQVDELKIIPRETNRGDFILRLPTSQDLSVILTVSIPASLPPEETEEAI